MQSKNIRIAIFGLGYVGCVTAACLARDGYSVVGVDISSSKLNSIRSGISPLGEPGLADLIAAAVADGKLTVTDDAKTALQKSNLSLICVGTPSLDNGALTSDFIVRVCEQIGRAIKEAADNHVVCVRSTMLPGTIQNLVIPTLEETSGLRANDDFHVAVNPEFLREGSAIKDFDNPPKTVIGTSSSFAAEMLSEMNKRFTSPVFVIPAEVAELVKCVDNAWHATKITFANEVGQLCDISNVDSNTLIDVFLADRQLNISAAYLRPGFAFGGSCLPKDLRALNYLSRHADIDLPMIQQVLQSNSLQIERVAHRILSRKIRDIAIFGLSFKVGTDDLRESPLVRLAEILIGKGCRLTIYDSMLNPSDLVGTNKEYMERHVPHLNELMVNDLDDLLINSKLLVIGHKTDEVDRWVNATKLGIEILDLVDIPELRGLPGASGLFR